MIQGLTAHRYRMGETELVLTKHLIRRRVEDGGFQDFADEVLGPLVVPPSPRDQGTWGDQQWWQPPSSGVARIDADAASCVVRLLNARGETTRTYGATELEVLFHPLRLALAARRALLVPIRPQWADHLMRYSPIADDYEQLELLGYSVDKLLLRSDNAYYCFPKCLPDVNRGAPILFYVSRPVKAVVGEARILQYQVDYPSVLHRLFGELGIYTEDQISSHVQGGGRREGMALALRFGMYVPFPKPVGAAKMQGIMGHQRRFAPQGLHPIPMNVFEALRTEGGLSW